MTGMNLFEKNIFYNILVDTFHSHDFLNQIHPLIVLKAR